VIPSLPNHDRDPQARLKQLAEARADYRFNYEYVPGIPFLDRVPKQENFSLRYWVERLWSSAGMPLNHAIAKARVALYDPLDRVRDYEKLFTVLRKPDLATCWLSDESFGDQRLTGCNPQALHRIGRVPTGMPVGDAELRNVLGPGRSLIAEIEQGHVYLIEYPKLEQIKDGGAWKGHQKTVKAPRAVFVWDAAARRMRCLGIQLRRVPEARLFKPSDPPLDWLAAKIAVQVADAIDQELGTHFTWTHAVMAPFAVVTRRQLAAQHPIHRLLHPHFRFFLYDNELGRTQFINPGGPVDRMIAGTLEESLSVPLQYYREWDLREATLPKDLARRGVDSRAILPEYPYRDDGLLVWDAVGRYTSSYVRLYYPADADVLSDSELQAWAAELASKDGGRVAGAPERIERVEQLVEILRVILWTCGPLHSMLNFAQYDYIFVPNMPYAMYGDVPEGEPISLEQIRRILPPYEQAVFQLDWSVILTSYHYDKLARYDERFADPRAQLILEVFQQQLVEIEKEIESREVTRRVSFPYFKPSRCINSINT